MVTRPAGVRKKSRAAQKPCVGRMFSRQGQKMARAHRNYSKNHQNFLKFLKIVTIMTIIQDHFSSKMLGVTIMMVM
jgi:hypothetical protein